MQHVERNGRTACDAIKKPKYAMHAREKQRMQSIRLCQPATAKFLFHDGWAASEVDDRRWSEI